VGGHAACQLTASREYLDIETTAGVSPTRRRPCTSSASWPGPPRV